MADAKGHGARQRLITVAVMAIAIGVHLAVVASILTTDRPVIWGLHNDTIHRAGRGADFFATYHAAVALERGTDPYAVDPDGVTPYFYAFRYLPAVAMAARPLTALPPVTAYRVWVLTLELLLGLALAVLWRQWPATTVRPVAAALLLVNSPYFLELFMGQFTFASTVLCALALLVPGGPLWFTGSVLLKPFTLAALPALVTVRRYRWHALTALIGLVGLSWPYFAQHPVQRNIFLDANFNPVGGMGVGNVGMMRVLSMAIDDAGMRWLAAHPTLWLSALRFAVLGATALLVLRARHGAAVSGTSALLLAHFLTYQQVWEHHASGIAILGALLLTARPAPATSALIVASLALIAVPTPFGWFDVAKDPSVFDPTGDWPRSGLYVIALSKALPTLALFACAVAVVRREGLVPLGDALRPSRLFVWKS